MVGVVRLHDDGADDVIEPRAKATASYDGAFCPAGIEVKFFPGAGSLEIQAYGFGELVAEFPVHLYGQAHVIHPGTVGQPGRELGGAESTDAGIDGAGLGHASPRGGMLG